MVAVFIERVLMPIDAFHLYSSPTSSCLLPLILAEARVGKQSKVWRFAASSHAESRDEFPRISEITGAKLLKLREVGAHASNSLSLKPSIRRNLALQKATNHPSHITPNTAAPTAAWATTTATKHRPTEARTSSPAPLEASGARPPDISIY